MVELEAAADIADDDTDVDARLFKRPQPNSGGAEAENKIEAADGRVPVLEFVADHLRCA